MTNASQTVTGTLTLTAFGQTATSTGSSSNPYMYAATSGYRNDGDAGLMHVGARYYDAQVGRFISRDTYLDQKPYLYCEHDPVNAVDPSGHDKDSEHLAGVLGAIGGIVAAAGNPEGGLLLGGIAGIVYIGGDIRDHTPPPTDRQKFDINLSPIFHFKITPPKA